MAKALRRRTTVAAIVVIAAAACATPSRTGGETRLRVMSYNIQAGGGHLDSIAAVIRSQTPDIVGLQEVDVHWADRSNFVDQATELGAKLGMQVRFAPIYRIPNANPALPMREYGVAVLSRFPITAFVNDSLTRLSTQDANAAPARVPGMVDALVSVAGRSVRVLVTHLDYRADPAVRIQQIAETLDYLSRRSIPTILCGDLNAPPDAAELNPLFRSLRDSWTLAGTGDSLTYPAAAPMKRIDYVLTSPHFEVRSARVPASMASDHRPIVSDLTLRDAPASR